MPDEVLNKIKYLCREIAKVEWSGILMYSVEGTIREPEKMVITLQDIIPMNKGTQAYTEYNFNEKKRDSSGYADRHIDYIEENEHALEWHLGHIHSHNTMSVFFSGTDMSELDDNSIAHNFYLSFIVNNFMDFTAKVAFRGTAESKISMPYIALDENGNKYTMEDSNFVVKKEKLFMYDCDIQSGKEVLKVDDFFLKSTSEIIAEADKPKIPVSLPQPVMKANVPIVNRPLSNFNNIKPKQTPANIVRGFMDDIPYEDIHNHVDNDIDDVEEFIIALLRGTNPPDDEVKTLFGALEELQVFKNDIKDTDIAQTIIENYPPLFEKYFEKEMDNPDYFVMITEEVIEMLEDYEDEYPFISKAIMALKYTLIKFEENESAI